MKIINSLEFNGSQAWEALDIAEIDCATVRLHWTDKPYVWHKNDGDEVFVVLDGKIRMHYLIDNNEQISILNPGDICYLAKNEEHVAHPVDGPARILVIEKKGSI